MIVVWIIVGGGFIMSAASGEGVAFIAALVLGGCVYIAVNAAGKDSASQNYEDAMSCLEQGEESDAAYKARCDRVGRKAEADARAETRMAGEAAGAAMFAALAAPFLAVAGIVVAAAAAIKRRKA